MCLYDFDFQSIVSLRKCVVFKPREGKRYLLQKYKDFFWLLGQIESIDDDEPSHTRSTS